MSWQKCPAAENDLWRDLALGYGYDCVTTFGFERGDWTFLAACLPGFRSSSPGPTPCVIPGTTKDSLGVAELLSASSTWLSSACQGPKTDLGGLHSVPSEWAKECSHRQEGESHRVIEAMASWRQGVILLLISKSTAGILDRFGVPHTNRDTRKLERIWQRGKKLFRGPTKSSWGVWARSV